MSGRGVKILSAEDRILWARITRTAVPLKGRGRASLSEAEEPAFAEQLLSQPEPAPPLAPRRAAAAGAAPPAPRSLDLPTRKKLAKGRLPIEGTVDLHGLTQSEAHALLLSFLHRAYADGRRHVLVITGKGESSRSDGVLRRAVPAWFATPPFRALVGGQEAAGRRHGGAGAIYVRLRRHEKNGAR
ncbi:MAG: Smr/MutS family protein [Hyphomicrobiales bacterium]|nr:Smr/MutS family protein [Hyphomicrobiales bacterium]